MPKTLPSSLNEVEAGCIEHPDIVFVFTFPALQSGTVEPRKVFVPGLMRVTVVLQKDGSISAPP